MRAVLLLASVTILGLAAAAWGQGADDEGFERVNQQGREQIDRINKALEQAGKVFAGIGLAVAGLVVVKIVSPARIADGVRERRLRKAVRDVDELVTRIQKEAEVTSEYSKKTEAADDSNVIRLPKR